MVREVGFVDSFAFKYSPRPGTAATDLPDRVPEEEAQERLEALQALQRSLTVAYHRRRVGESVEVLVEGPSRKAALDVGGAGPQLQGRDPYHRVVNFRAQDALPPGRMVRLELVEATPHSLIGELAGVQPRPPLADEMGQPVGLA